MKLQRIRIEQLRQFGKPFELRDIDAGLNLFTGPNEAGKSTVVRAIRAAFFERYRTESVQDLVPHDDAHAAPTVELDFVIGGEAYALRKVWLKKKRCELSIAGRRLDGEEAEAHLAQLLGFGFSDKSASRPRHWGVPGLLWIEQGAGHEIGDAVTHAADHLRGALTATAAEVASTQGDAVIAQVKKLRDELLTEAKGTPRAEFAKAIAERERLEDECAKLDQDAAGYRQQVDELAGLAVEHVAEQAAKPWEALRTQQTAAQQRLRAIEQRKAELDADAKACERIDQQIALLNAKLSDHDDKRKAVQTRQLALAASAEEARVAAAAYLLWADRQRAAEQLLTQTQTLLTAAETEDLRATLQQQLRDASGQLETLTRHLTAAEQEAATLQTALDVQAESSLPPTALQTLKDRHTKLRELQIRREAVQTRIEFNFADAANGKGVALDGELLRGSGQRSIDRSVTLVIPSVGSITVMPGHTDAAQLAREEAALQAAQQADLQRHGVATLAEADARQLRHAQAQADVAQARKALTQFAPNGLDALREARAVQQRRHTEAAHRLQGLASAQGLQAEGGGVGTGQQPAVPPLAEARAQRDAAEVSLKRVIAQAQSVQIAASSATAKAELAQSEHVALVQETTSPAYLQRHDEATRAVGTLRTERQTATDRIAVRRRELDSGDSLEALVGDVERFGKSAAHAHDRFLQRNERIAQLRGQLEAVGAQGLDERRAQRAARLEQTRRREQEMKARAAALSLLLDRLTEQRRLATQRLQAPLQKHVTRYLHLLFPGARLEIADNLQPTVLTRIGGAQHATGSPLDALSFGAREQMGVLSRLAYADLLKEANHPTLVILDDALVHSDADRLAQMKRVLFDAARRHQILLFTCHPDAWRDAGAPLRLIGAV